MLKFLFELFTDPLGLPLVWYWDLLIMAAIGAIAFAAGWIVSPGGRFGSLIHWLVRFIAFIALWALVYGIITATQWILANWLLVVIIIGVFAVITTVVVLIVSYKRKKKERPSEVSSDA